MNAERRPVGVLPVVVEREGSRNRAVGVLVEVPPGGEMTRRGLPGSDGRGDEATGRSERGLAVCLVGNRVEGNRDVVEVARTVDHVDERVCPVLLVVVGEGD